MRRQPGLSPGCLKRFQTEFTHFEGESLPDPADSIYTHCDTAAVRRWTKFISFPRARSTGRPITLPSYPHFSGNKDIMQFWNELEGQTIDGLYPLRRLVRSEGRSAWFETETGEPQSTPATISLTEALTDADEVIARLQAAQHLKHPNLVSITKVGQVKVDNTLLVYAVMEHIEQSLSDVLQSQALTPEEGREVAEALVGALTAIHQKGMSHGRVEAASVLATEETVKLRSDCLHPNRSRPGRRRGRHRHHPLSRLHPAERAHRHGCTDQSHPGAVRGDYSQLLRPALDLSPNQQCLEASAAGRQRDAATGSSASSSACSRAGSTRRGSSSCASAGSGPNPASSACARCGEPSARAHCGQSSSRRRRRLPSV